MNYLLSLKFLQKYIDKNKINYEGKTEKFPLRQEELIKVFYPVIGFEKNFIYTILQEREGIAGGEYPVLTVYLTKNNTWGFRFKEEFTGTIVKELFVSYKEFPYW